MKNTRRYDLWILMLLVTGWILASFQDSYGVALASTGVRDPLNYWNYVCVGNAGYFSGSVMVEDTWEEGAHGHSFPVGPCIAANVISLLVPFSAASIIFFIHSRKFWLKLWEWLVMGLAFMGIYMSYTQWRFAIESLALAFVLLGFEVFLFVLKFRAKKQDRSAIDILSKNILLFYPLWILALALTQQAPPLIGLALTLAGCVMLALRTEDNASTNEMSIIQAKTI